MADDLEELRRLLHDAKRPRVQNLLSTEIANLEKVQQSTNAAVEEQTARLKALDAPTKEVAAPEKKIAPPSIRYSTLSTFSWDQDTDKVKIYIPLEGASQEKTVVDFQTASLDLKVHDVNGKSYHFCIQKLSKEIVPTASRVIVKPKRIILSLKKADSRNWLDLVKREEKIKPPSSMEKDGDPMASLMGLMKNMYDEGDDEMKKTIAKAWTDARTGQNANKPDFGSSLTDTF